MKDNIEEDDNRWRMWWKESPPLNAEIEMMNPKMGGTIHRVTVDERMMTKFAIHGWDCWRWGAKL